MIDITTPVRKKILVVGASGFIGIRLIEKLTDKSEFEVTALVRDASKAKPLQAKGVHTVVADLSNYPDIDGAVQGHHTVVNLAHDFKRSQKVNLRNFANLTNACTKHAVQHFVHVSSIVVYDDWPVADITEKSTCDLVGTEYKNTKVAIENALQQNSEKGLLHSSILQPTVVYGPRSWLWTDYIVEKLLTGTVVLPADGQGVCNAVYVDDVVDALVLAVMNPGRCSEKYIISGPEPTTWNEFFESHNQFLGKDSVQYLDGEKLGVERSGLTGKINHGLANSTRLANWRPVRLILNMLEKLLGARVIESLKDLVRSLKKTRRNIIYYPDANELRLYYAKGECRIEKAKEMLGYAPKFDFKSGFALTTEYIGSQLSTDSD